ncbi:MAG: insulinase family protein [Gemmatimonadetes bacterium]|nr:insulinase family protein [Gemmatimonadota bacterium]
MEPTFLQRLPTHERRLDNGLVVIVREDHSAPVVAVVTHVKAGYFDEPDTLIGISHVLEHMYFKGTQRRGPGEIARETKGAGGYLNAGTIYDHTSYYTVLPSDALDQALDIQSDALQRSAINDDELRRELQVIVQEARRKLDNPGAVAQETLFETMFDVHRIRRWRIGTESLLESFTRDDVWEYYRNLYRASNTTVVIAGDVNPDHAFELAMQYYGDMDAGESVRDAGAPEPQRREFRYREIDGDIARSHVEWGWRTPGRMHEDTAALDVLAIALGSGRASRLYRDVRDAGCVSSISAYNYNPGDIGVFGIGAELDPEDADRALHAISSVIRSVREHGLTTAEVERARNILEARMLRRTETAEGQANLIADWQAAGNWRLADEYLARVLAVTGPELQDVARRYLDPAALTLLLYRPSSTPQYAAQPQAVSGMLFKSISEVAGPPGADAVDDGADGVAPAEAADAAGPVDNADAARPDAAGGPAVKVGGRLTPRRVEDGVRFYAVHGHDARIIVKSRTTIPLVSIGLYCRGGILAEHADTAGMTGLMSRTSVKGTHSRTGVRLAEESEAMGATISPGVSFDTIEWTMSLPARHFEGGLELLLDAALEPAFRIEDAERERKMTLSGLEQLRDDMQQYPMRLALAAAFDGHPYGFGLPQLEESIRTADLSALAAWHEQRVLRGAPQVIVVGDISDPDGVAGFIAQRLAGRVHDPVGVHPTPPRWPTAAVQQVEHRDKAQTALVLAFPGPPRNHPEGYALQLLSSAVSGLGGRLFEELRSRRSLAYSVSAAPMMRWQAGAFLAYIGMAPERELEARAEMMRELLRTTTEVLEPDELERARRYLIGSWQIRQQTHSRQLADLAGAVLLGEGLAELREYIPRIQAVSAEDVRAAAERWIRPEHVVEAVIRGTGGSR